ncbi:RHS repeat-associated protein [Thermocatellispora tengchongensis]|uniref:RHS repeat-associated protein n=1 Tax=Thermocatellispora tengchongensis TaxID=1073253 RepID=A0A840P3I4_9ACTN|nr:RHS repeat-associated core domain-containing protein [Thermocatellispora tengchongensis]MBB5132453.1 RHS repeat-associated protein [Thermocatellispora tengchongensis]
MLVFVVTPGMLQLPVFPAWAEPQPAPLVTPQQFIGSAAGLPEFVDAAATRAKESKEKKPAAKAERPEGALAPDLRDPAKVDHRPSLSAPGLMGRDGPVGQEAARKRVPSASDLLTSAGALLPTIGAVYPEDQSEVDSLTPQLRAQVYASASSPWWEVERLYRICEVTDGGNTGACLESEWKDSYEPYWQVPSGFLKWGESYLWEIRARDTITGETSIVQDISFTTAVRQPGVSSQLASRGVNGQEFHHLAGNYTTTFSDVSVAVVGPPLAVVRSYNSLDPRKDGLFGAGWSTRYDMKIESEGGSPESLLVTFPDGRQLRFRQKGSTTSYQSPAAMHFTLAKVSGGGWRLMDKASTVYEFDAQGRLLKLSDSRGRGQDLTYGTDGRLQKVTATGGRSLTFTWSGNHVGSVATDPVDGTAMTWTYHYDGDRLTQVCSPAAAPNCTVYTYGTGSRYREVVLDDRPVGYYRLGERKPEALGFDCYPDETNQRACLFASEGVQTDRPGVLAGTTNTAAGFQGNGTSSFLELGGVVPQLGESLSVEAWFKTTGPGFIFWAGQGEWDPAEPRPGAPGLYVGTDGKLRGQMTVASWWGEPLAPVTSQNRVDNGQWHHAVITVADGVTTLYVDGAVAGTSNVGVETYNWLDTALIGSGAADSYLPGTPPENDVPAEFAFTGSIDEFAFYDRALNAQQVQAHYQARTEAPYTLTKIALPSGRTWMSNTYDPSSGRVVTHTDQHGGTWTAGTRTYDWWTGLSTVTVTDPHGGTLKYEHDVWRGNRLVSETDQLGHKTSYSYDTGGYSTKVIDRNGNTVERTTDERGNVLSSTTCRTTSDCQTEYYTYYVNTQNEFDPRNDQMIASRDARSAHMFDNTFATKWEFNEYGDLVKETTPATDDFPNGRSSTSTYTDGTEPAVPTGTTPAGLLKSEKDAKGNETTYRYTAAGDVAEVTDPSGLVIRFTYDALGRTTSRTEISDAHPDGVTTQFRYDSAGRLSAHTGAPVKNEISGVTHQPETRYTYTPDGHRATESVVDLTGGDPERKISYTYDDYGRVASITGPEGGVVQYTWDHTGARTSVTDELGNVFHYAYTARGELKSRTLKNWTGSPVSPKPPTDLMLESYTYDPEGRLAAEADVLGRKLAYKYFGDDLRAEVMADDVRLNNFTTPQDVVLESNAYDDAGNLTGRALGGGKQNIAMAYDEANRLAWEIFDPLGLGRQIEYTYDANDNVTSETMTATGTGRTERTEFAYNADDARIRRTVENGDTDLVTTWTVDDRGLVTKMTDPRGNLPGADAAAFTTDYRYDAAGQLVEVSAPPVKVEESGTSAVTARPTVAFGYDSAGRRTHSRDEKGRVTTVGYDRLGRATTVTEPSYTPPGGSTLTPVTTYAYDAAGRVTQYTDPRGSTWKTEYDAFGNRVRVTEPGPQGQPGGAWIYEYNNAGELLASVDPTGARNEATYDGLGRQVTVTMIERKPTTKALTTTMEYDTAGHKIKEVAPGNRTTLYEVNPAGEVTKVTDPLGDTTEYAYDLAGRSIETVDPLGNATVHEYDLAGREIAVKDLDDAGQVLRSIGYEYDAVGNPIAETSGEGNRVQRVYDATDALVELIEPVSADASVTTTYGYDATGAMTRTTDGRGNTVWTTYNSLGLAESVIEPATAAHPQPADRTWTNIYDVGGNLTAVLQPGGVRIDREYDHLGRLVKESGTGAQVATPVRTFGYDLAGRDTAIGDYTLEYNDRGLITKVSRGTTQVAAFTYDDMGNVTQRADTSGTAAFGWDNDDRLRTAADPVSGRSFTYTYDDADRVTSLTSANPTTTQSFSYDALDRLISHTLKNSGGTEIAKITYGWDKDDQLVSKVTSGTAGAGTNSYGYDRMGRLISWTAPNGNTTQYEWDPAGNRTKAGDATFTYDERNRLLSGGGVEYTYTPRGTVATETENGVTRNLTFDAFDRLVADGQATYTYDALGRLASRSTAGGTENFHYSGTANDIVSVTDGTGAVQATYGRTPTGELLSMKEGTGPALGVLSDQHGDVVGTFSGTALVDSTAYDPFGEVTAQTGTKRRLGYQGEYTDPDTGKVNMHARWYIPGTGGFASRDDITLTPYPSANLNRYAYALGDPLSLDDPTGNCPFCIPLAWMAARMAAQIIARQIAQRLAAEAAKRLAIEAAKRAAAQLAQKTAQQATKKVAQTAGKKLAQTTAKKGAQNTVKRGAQQSAKKAVKDKAKQQVKNKVRDQTKKQIKKEIKNKAKEKSKQQSKQQAKDKAKERAKQKAKEKAQQRAKQKAKEKAKQKEREKAKKKAEAAKKKAQSTKKKQQNKPTGDSRFEILESYVEESGIEPLGDIDGCVSFKGCAKEVVEDIVEDTTESLIEDVIDDVAPDLPLVGTPGDGSGSCERRPNSFVPGTRVLMADGTTKPIEDVKVGDHVQATDPETGRTEPRLVTTLITGDGVKHLVELTIDIDGDHGDATDVITATDEHPFWVPDLREWVPAGQLDKGTWLQTSAGTYVQITAVKEWTATQRVHNLTIYDLHTYHVVAGDQAVLVHNTTPRGDCGPIDDDAGAQARCKRDDLGNALGKKHATYCGGYDSDGNAYAGCSGNPTGCAENDIERQAGRGPGGVRFEGAFGWRQGEWTEIPVCERCQERYDRDQFPPGITFDPGGRWSRER